MIGLRLRRAGPRSWPVAELGLRVDRTLDRLTQRRAFRRPWDVNCVSARSPKAGKFVSIVSALAAPGGLRRTGGRRTDGPAAKRVARGCPRGGAADRLSAPPPSPPSGSGL